MTVLIEAVWSGSIWKTPKPSCGISTPLLSRMVGTGTERQDWWAELSIPWEKPSKIWRANFYRVERPRDGAPEFTCWSPTLTNPADFHKPARFGLLELGDV